MTNLRTLLSFCWLLMFMISRWRSQSIANKMLFLELSLSSELLAGEAGRPGNRLGLDPEEPVGLIN